MQQNALLLRGYAEEHGRTAERMGNHHPSYAPHGCYPRQGEDNWVTIAVASDQEWGASCDAMGRPELAKDEFDAALHLNLYDGLHSRLTRNQNHGNLSHTGTMPKKPV